MDDRWHLVAALSAVPPGHILTIGEAEAWAAWLVFANTVTRKAAITDCKANLALRDRGKEWATDAKRTAARTWAAIFATLEDDVEAARQ